MNVSLVCVGRPRGALAPAIAEYESRIGHYFRFEAVEVREAPRRTQSVPQFLEEEGGRLLARVPQQNELIALHRKGTLWSSEKLARHLSEASLRSAPGTTFVIGGAFGLADPVLDRANHLLSLSAMTFPHEVARLLLSEQLYRAGTIMRGEPYHKGSR